MNTILGIDIFGVIAYENIFPKKENYIVFNKKRVYTGLTWECVEFVRRWYIMNYHMSFEYIENAYDIWNISFVKHMLNNKIYPFISIINTNLCIPHVGDILVYRPTELNPYGHVAIVICIEDIFVYISEQNHGTWENPFFSRIIIPYNDPDVIGWKRIIYTN